MSINQGEKTLASKTIMIIAVVIVAVICVAGAFVLLSNNDEEKASPTSITVAGSTTVEPVMTNFQEAYEKVANVSISVTAAGSGTAAPAIRNGLANIGMLSRDPTASESDMTPLIIAGDAVVILVDKNANVTDLTLEQVAKIYAGEIKNWNEFPGGANLTIRPIIRDDSSGTRTCLDDLMAPKLGISVAQLALKYTSYPMQATTGGMTTMANNVSGSIGYVNLGELSSLGTSAPNVVAISISGVMPSAASVKDGSYEISRNLILITSGAPTGEVKAFLDWIMSPAGQKIVENRGFVPVAPTA
jgi:phosphate transport system substrate-binding protein